MHFSETKIVFSTEGGWAMIAGGSQLMNKFQSAPDVEKL